MDSFGGDIKVCGRINLYVLPMVINGVKTKSTYVHRQNIQIDPTTDFNVPDKVVHEESHTSISQQRPQTYR